MVLLISFLLSACNLLGISKVEKTPSNVQELIDPAATLQSVTKNGEMTYLIYQSKDSVTASLDKQGNKLNIRLKTAPKDNNRIEQHVFKVKVDSSTETIDVLINGKSTPIDVISGL
jgi:outer membrane biogenesis lipoprotein LolB